MINLYKKLITVFDKAETKEAFLDKNVRPVAYIDLYAGQEQFEENFELFAQPALLVDWDIDHTQTPPIATLTCYCCFEQMRDTSNISLNRDLGLKFLDYVATIDEIITTIETISTGKPELISEGFHKMDSIVDVYLLTYEFSYTGRIKNPQGKYQEGEYDTLAIQTNLVKKFDFD